MRDPYSILGVNKSADQQEIKAAWRAAAKALHPDQNPNDPFAASRFTEAGRAYDLLKDPNKRRLFDDARMRADTGRTTKEKTFMEQRAERARAEAEAKARSARAKPAPKEEELDEEAEDLVAKIFGTRKGPEAQAEQRQGSAQPKPESRTKTDDRPQPDAAAQANSTQANSAPQDDGPAFETPQEAPQQDGRTSPALELINYVFKRLTRQVPPPEKAPDLVLDASVTIEEVLRHASTTVMLPEGRVLNVHIPNDAKDGTRIRFDGLGHRFAGVKRGDLVVVLRLKPHTWYRHNGYDLLTYVDIDIENAVLGCETTVETPDGPTKITIPPWTGSQFKSVIPGRGLPKGGDARGDLIAEVRVLLWDRPDQRVIDLMRSMREGLYL